MEFRTWFESKHNPWYLFNDTAVLYHGTSSAFLDIIGTVGLLPPKQNLLEYAREIAKKYLPDVPDAEIDKMVKDAVDFRKDNERHRTSNVIYLAGGWKEAKSYAESYYRHGGEIGYEIWTKANNYVAYKNLGWKWRQAQYDTHVKPIFSDAHPIIVEVEVPKKWMKSYYDLWEKYNGAIKHWQRLQKWYEERGMSFSDYLAKEVVGVEIRVEHIIPTSMIREIHHLPKVQSLKPGEPES